ncbi:TrkA C-terminal domain-containing protein [Bacillus horti]|uniref:RCK C-terminal domain-containing protein n=1 Tax=Caldalkalibacillus horti TaxID=77523 RepID=A0ABT9VU17_9BACI|nr:TrkA C-terminal domain-containing protein [Bacillus horti]MDQ0164115.1 hypothetical protein [Bacillus horti]
MSWLFLLLIFTLLVIIIEVATIILEATGLSKNVARFQAISLLTNTGYTTTEAELITKHPVRRKIAETLIVFGTIAFAVILALIINIVNEQFRYDQVLLGLIILALVFLFFRLRYVKDRMIKRFKGEIEKHLTLQEAFQLGDSEMVAVVRLTHRHKRLFFPLKHLDLAHRFDVHILTISRERRNGDKIETELVKQPTGRTVLQEGDQLLVFGNIHHLKDVFGGALDS